MPMHHQYDYYYRRRLPHIQPRDATYFVTYRLVGSIPKIMLTKLKSEKEDFERKLLRVKDENKRAELLYNYRKRYFKKFDDILDKIVSGPDWLKDDNAAGIVANAMHFYDETRYDLYAYCIMPNHVHMVFHVSRDHLSINGNELSTIEYDNPHTKTAQPGKKRYIVTDILESIKKYTATRCNDVLNRKGQFWQRESYDHIVRNEKELIRIIKYVLNNPVKAGFVERPEDWKWSYCREDIRLDV